MIPVPFKVPVYKKEQFNLTGTGHVKHMKAIRGFDQATYSCWKPTFIEKVMIILGFPVVLGILTNGSVPPSTIGVGERFVPLGKEPRF